MVFAPGLERIFISMNKYLNPKNYINFAINRSLAWLEPIIHKWEKSYLEKFGSQPLKHQPIFIIGAPRTGSTILYQTLTNLYDVLYVDNLVCRFHKNLFFGFWLSNKLFGARPHNNYEADHGSTKGLHAPSECGKFWYKWLPTDHHFIDYNEITEEMVRQIQKEISAIINYFNKPIVFGNNNAGLRIRLLTKCFPSAKFIFINREPLSVAISLLNAREKFFNDCRKWWSILPPNFNDLLYLPPHEQVIHQHYYINKQMLNDLFLFSNCYALTDYKYICSDYKKALRENLEVINLDLEKRKMPIKYPWLSYVENSCSDIDLANKMINTIRSLDFDDYTS